MVTTELDKVEVSGQLFVKIKVLIELLKPRLSFLVAFSAGFGYLLALNAQEGFDWLKFSGICLGGFLISGASIIINQIIEKDLDKLMSRTMNRPIPSGRIQVQEAIVYGFLIAATGLLLLFLVSNLLTTLLAFLSLVLYAFVYTPLKRVGSIAVFVGAIPGALPPLLGFVSVSNAITHEGLIIFALQFIWQFPHFWAIAWVLDEDYAKAGFKLLPSKNGKDINSAFQIMVYTFFLIPFALLPLKFGISGISSALIMTICGLLFLIPTFQLMKLQTKEVARKIMFGSFLYLPIVQIAILLDKL